MKRARSEGWFGYRLKVTRTGRTFLFVTLGVGLGALNTGNNLLYLVLGFMLSSIVVSGVLSERCLRHLVIRRVGKEAAYAGEPFALRYGVRRARGSAFALTLSEVCDALTGEGRLAHVTPSQELLVRADLVAARRGPLRLTGVRVTTTYPLGLFEKSRVVPLEGQLLVYPRRGFTCIDPPELGAGPLGDGGNPRRRDGNGDLLGLRELADGEDARRIHWVKSAAAGKMLRTEREREERRQYLLEVPGALAGEALERRCEEAAALAHRLLAQGHEVGVATGTAKLRPAGGPGQERRVLCALAWAGFEEGA
ncbi:MAG: DUF58 domain-containing protein [Myxococcota bacterium]